MIVGNAMERKYLFVPPEESERVRALGAQWDDGVKCWYLGLGLSVERFERWLRHGDEEEELNIFSSEAYVAAADVACQGCGMVVEVICIHCVSGMVDREASIYPFTVAGIWGMDDGLLEQLGAWPGFRMAEGVFVNHCLSCGRVQGEMELHGEVEGVFLMWLMQGREK